MSATAFEVIVTEPSRPPAEPDRDANFNQDNVRELPSGGRHTLGGDVSGREVARSPARPSAGPLACTRVDDQLIVTDLLGAVYGVGQTEDAALDDYFRALDAHLEFLREREGVLHERLQRELAVLTRLFPGR
jgi:hypothetical protein